MNDINTVELIRDIIGSGNDSELSDRVGTLWGFIGQDIFKLFDVAADANRLGSTRAIAARYFTIGAMRSPIDWSNQLGELAAHPNPMIREGVMYAYDSIGERDRVAAFISDSDAIISETASELVTTVWRLG